MSYRMDITQLESYGRELVASGEFDVWLTYTAPNKSEGYLQYRDRATGNSGSLQCTYFGEWQHLMPLIPSREYGSAMHMQDPLPPFTIEAARQCASDTNYNDAVRARLRNARDRQWRSSDAVPLHTD